MEPSHDQPRFWTLLGPRTQCNGDIFSPSFTGMGVGWCDTFPMTSICAHWPPRMFCGILSHFPDWGPQPVSPTPVALISSKRLKLKQLSSLFLFNFDLCRTLLVFTDSLCNEYIFICISSSTFSFPLRGLFPYLTGLTAGNNSKATRGQAGGRWYFCHHQIDPVGSPFLFFLPRGWCQGLAQGVAPDSLHRRPTPQENQLPAPCETCSFPFRRKQGKISPALLPYLQPTQGLVLYPQSWSPLPADNV